MRDPNTPLRAKSAHAATLPVLAVLAATALGVSAALVWLSGSRATRRAAPEMDRTDRRLPAEPGPPPREAEPLSAPEASLFLVEVPAHPIERTPLARSSAAPELEHDLLASSNPREQFEGLRLLAQRSAREALPEILGFIEATRDSEPKLLQRITAVRLLGRLEGVSTGPELLALYEEDEPGIRRAAAKALEEQGDPALVRRELDGLRAGLVSPDGGLRARAAEQTAQLASPVAVPALLPLLSDENSEVRIQAIDGLWLANDPTLLPELRGMLADPVERVRERARRAIQALSANADAEGR